MAIAVLSDPVPVVIFPWPVFTANGTDGLPLIGGQLFSYQAGTSTPKSTYADPFMTVPNPNPTILNSEGQAIVYLLDLYKLRLLDPDGVLLWEVDSYTFSSGVTPGDGAVQVGTSSTTLTAIDGASVLTAPGLVPAGYRVLGVVTRILTDFGTAHGLERLLIGDAVVEDRWGVTTSLTATVTTRQAQFHAADAPIAVTPYTCLVAADGGLFAGAGPIQL